MQAPGTNDVPPGTDLTDAADKPARPRKWAEAAGWAAIVAVLWGTDLLAKFSERDQTGIGKDNFRLISEQATSAIAVLIMIGFVVRWLQLFPLKRDAWVPAIIGHTAGTILFAFGHQFLMVAMRIPWYALNGETYIWREPFVANLITEYQKDIKVYFGIVLIATAWQVYQRSRVPSATSDSSPAPVAPQERLVVQTGQGTRVLRLDEIDYLEAARNYVAVHAGGREYVVRETMSKLSLQLPGGRFARTHRSFIVNMEGIREVRTVDGKPRVFLACGADVPLSRSYRDAFNASMTGQDQRRRSTE